ncbi:Cyclin-T2 [Blattella germanica]|nr:Cyclin-T2 [Blattella germanica]
MAADEKWYFTKEQLANTPSRKCGYEVDKELSYRQQAANFIQDMGQRLQVYPSREKNVMLVYGASEKVVFVIVESNFIVRNTFIT